MRVMLKVCWLGMGMSLEPLVRALRVQAFAIPTQVQIRAEGFTRDGVDGEAVFRAFVVVFPRQRQRLLLGTGLQDFFQHVRCDVIRGEYRARQAHLRGLVGDAVPGHPFVHPVPVRWF